MQSPDASLTATAKAPPRHYRLGTQVLLGLAVMAAVVALCAALIVRQLERDYLISLMAAESERTFELIVSASLENIISEDLPRLETTTRQVVARDPDLVLVEMTNERGIVLYSWQRGSQVRRMHFLDWLGRGHGLLHFAKDVVFEGETFGTVVAEWDTTRTDLDVARHSYLIALAVVAICALLGAFAYAVVNGVAVVPISRMTRRVLRLKDGSLEGETKLPAIASTEMRELDHAVDVLGRFLALERRRTVELEAAKDAAEQASHAKSAFLTVISHELRSPLHLINGFSEIINNQIHGPLGDKRYKDYVGHILASGQHLLSLIDDLLDMAKLDTGKVALRMEEFDLAELIPEALKRTRPPPSAGRAPVTAEIAPDLPRLRADKPRIRQVLVNLISNALKFTPGDGRITVSAYWSRGFGMTIQVQDTGIGIAEENLDLVLEPFRQVEAPLSRSHQGSGLGLPLAKALIELHGGDLRIDSRPSVGTTVTVTLPPELVAEPAEGTEVPCAASVPRAVSN